MFSCGASVLEISIVCLRIIIMIHNLFTFEIDLVKGSYSILFVTMVVHERILNSISVNPYTIKSWRKYSEEVVDIQL